jgi:hypothetical protein
MIELFDRLREEWKTISKAKASFFIVCAVAVASLFGVFHWYYGGRLEEAAKSGSQWQNTAAYWKEQAEIFKAGKCSPPQAETPGVKSGPESHSAGGKFTTTTHGPNSPAIGQNNGTLNFGEQPPTFTMKKAKANFKAGGLYETDYELTVVSSGPVILHLTAKGSYLQGGMMVWKKSPLRADDDPLMNLTDDQFAENGAATVSVPEVEAGVYTIKMHSMQPDNIIISNE